MDATSFELKISLPAEARLVEPMRDLAIHAARYAGCAGAAANAYGAAVEDVLRQCVAALPGRVLPVVVRREQGPVEFLVAAEGRIEPAPAADSHITLRWTERAGRRMYCVARSMPADL